MKQTLASNRNKYYKSDLLVLRKNTYSPDVLEAVIREIERQLLNAPNIYDETCENNKTLSMFKDTMYGSENVKRVARFDQYGTFYLFEVFDDSVDKFVYILYSIYDIIECFNTTGLKTTVPYVRLFDSIENIKPVIRKVKSPYNYTGEEVALNESNKFIAEFGDKHVEFIVTPTVIAVGSKFEPVNSTASKTEIVGKAKFVIGDLISINGYAFDEDLVDGTEYKNIFDDISSRNDIESYAPNGIINWTVEYSTGKESEVTDDIGSIEVVNGAVTFTANLKEPEPEEDDEEEENPPSEDPENPDENQEPDPDPEQPEEPEKKIISFSTALINCYIEGAESDTPYVLYELNSEGGVSFKVKANEGYHLLNVKITNGDNTISDNQCEALTEFTVALSSEDIGEATTFDLVATAEEIVNQDPDPEPEDKNLDFVWNFQDSSTYTSVQNTTATINSADNGDGLHISATVNAETENAKLEYAVNSDPDCGGCAQFNEGTTISIEVPAGYKLFVEEGHTSVTKLSIKCNGEDVTPETFAEESGIVVISATSGTYLHKISLIKIEE